MQTIIKDKRFRPVSGLVTHGRLLTPIMGNITGRAIVTDPPIQFPNLLMDVVRAQKDSDANSALSKGVPAFPDSLFAIEDAIQNLTADIYAFDIGAKIMEPRVASVERSGSTWLSRLAAMGGFGLRTTTIAQLVERAEAGREGCFDGPTVDEDETKGGRARVTAFIQRYFGALGGKHGHAFFKAGTLPAEYAVTQILDPAKTLREGKSLSYPNFPMEWLVVNPQLNDPFAPGPGKTVISNDLLPYGNVNPVGIWCEILGVKQVDETDEGTSSVCYSQSMMKFLVRMSWLQNIGRIIKSDTLMNTFVNELPDVSKTDKTAIARARGLASAMIMKAYALQTAVVAANLLENFLMWEPVVEAYRAQIKEAVHSQIVQQVREIADLPLCPPLAALGRFFGRTNSAPSAWGSNPTVVLPLEVYTQAFNTVDNNGVIPKGGGAIKESNPRIAALTVNVQDVQDSWVDAVSRDSRDLIWARRLKESPSAQFTTVGTLAAIVARAAQFLKNDAGSFQLRPIYDMVAKECGWRKWDALSSDTISSPDQEAIVISLQGTDKRVASTLDLTTLETINIPEVFSPDYKIVSGLVASADSRLRMIPVPVNMDARIQRLTDINTTPKALVAINHEAATLQRLSREGIDIKVYSNTLAGLSEALGLPLQELIADIRSNSEEYKHLGSLSADCTWTFTDGRNAIIGSEALTTIAKQGGIVYIRSRLAETVLSRRDRFVEKMNLDRIASVISPDLPVASVDLLGAGSQDLNILGIRTQ